VATTLAFTWESQRAALAGIRETPRRYFVVFSHKMFENIISLVDVQIYCKYLPGRENIKI
jgi:hypothetical protein